MKNGFRVYWTDNAISELKETINYLEENWTKRDLKIFFAHLDQTIEIISRSPEIFPLSIETKNIRRAVVEKHNSLYYRVNSNSVQIISMFSNRKNPKSRKV